MQILCCKIIIVIPLPACLVRKHQVIDSILFEHGRRFPSGSDILSRQLHRLRTGLIQPVDISLVGQQISRAVVIHKSSHIPEPDGLSLKEQRSLKRKLLIQTLPNCKPDTGITVSVIIRMHQHAVPARPLTFQDFYPLSYTAWPKQPVLQGRQGKPFKFPVRKIIGRITGKSPVLVDVIRLVFAKQVIRFPLLHNTRPMGVNCISVLVIPRDSIIDRSLHHYTSIVFPCSCAGTHRCVLTYFLWASICI